MNDNIVINLSLQDAIQWYQPTIYDTPDLPGIRRRINQLLSTPEALTQWLSEQPDDLTAKQGDKYGCLVGQFLNSHLSKISVHSLYLMHQGNIVEKNPAWVVELVEEFDAWGHAVLRNPDGRFKQFLEEPDSLHIGKKDMMGLLKRVKEKHFPQPWPFTERPPIPVGEEIIRQEELV